MGVILPPTPPPFRSPNNDQPETMRMIMLLMKMSKTETPVASALRLTSGLMSSSEIFSMTPTDRLRNIAIRAMVCSRFSNLLAIGRRYTYRMANSAEIMAPIPICFKNPNDYLTITWPYFRRSYYHSAQKVFILDWLSDHHVSRK